MDRYYHRSRIQQSILVVLTPFHYRTRLSQGPVDDQHQQEHCSFSSLPRGLLWPRHVHQPHTIPISVPAARLLLPLQFGIWRALLSGSPASPSALRQVHCRQCCPAARRLDLLSGQLFILGLQQLHVQQLLVRIVVPSRES